MQTLGHTVCLSSCCLVNVAAGCSGRKELSGSRSSPKLEWRAGTGTQGPASTDSSSSPQQNDSLGSRHKPVTRVSPHRKRPEADARPSSTEAAQLTDGASDPCGADLKVQDSSNQVTVTGYQPGGAVEKVTDFLVTWDPVSLV